VTAAGERAAAAIAQLQVDVGELASMAEAGVTRPAPAAPTDPPGAGHGA